MNKSIVRGGELERPGRSVPIVPFQVEARGIRFEPLDGGKYFRMRGRVRGGADPGEDRQPDDLAGHLHEPEGQQEDKDEFFPFPTLHGFAR